MKAMGSQELRSAVMKMQRKSNEGAAGPGLSTDTNTDLRREKAPPGYGWVFAGELAGERRKRKICFKKTNEVKLLALTYCGTNPMAVLVGWWTW